MYLLGLLILLYAVLGTQGEIHDDGSENKKYQKLHNFLVPNQTLIGDDQLIAIFNSSKFHFDSIIDLKLSLAEIVLTNLLMPLTTSLSTTASRSLSKYSLRKESAINKVKLISELIRDQINGIARDFKLVGRSRVRPQSLIISKNRNFGNFTEQTIREGYLIVRDIGEIVKEVYCKASNRFRSFTESFRRHGYKITRVQSKNYHTINDESIFYIIEQFIETILDIQNCLNSDKRHYDLRIALMKLTGRSSADSLRLLKNRLNRPLSRFLRKNKTYKQLYALFICHVAVDSFRRDFENCLREIQRIEECLDQYNSDRKSRSRSNNWMRSIKHLDTTCADTKSNDDFHSINCTSERKIPNSVNRQVELIFKGLSGFELKTSPILKDVANDLVKILEKSDYGRRSCYRMCQLSMIYQTGKNRKNRLEKMMNNNNHAVGELKSVSQNFHNFRNGILRETIHFIDRLRKCIRSLINIFSDSVKIGLDKSWLEIIQVLDWLFKLFAQVNTQRHSNNVKGQKSSAFDHYDITQLGSSDQNRKVSEERLANFLQSINNYNSRKWKHQNTAVGGIAKSLLLGTLLLEMLAFMGTLFDNNETKQHVPKDKVQLFSEKFRMGKNVGPFIESLQTESHIVWNTNDAINGLSKHLRQSHIARNWKRNTKLSNEVIQYFKTDPENLSEKSN